MGMGDLSYNNEYKIFLTLSTYSSDLNFEPLYLIDGISDISVMYIDVYYFII